jgi:hypothetical protein
MLHPYDQLIADALDWDGDRAEGAVMEGACDDPTPVPGWVIPAVIAAAMANGYAINWDGAEDPDSAGTTNLHTRVIRMDPATLASTPASQAHTLIHELAHAYQDSLYSPPMIEIMFGERIHDEVLAEATAALVTESLGISDGRFARAYLHQRISWLHHGGFDVPTFLAEGRQHIIGHAAKLRAAIIGHAAPAAA